MLIQLSKSLCVSNINCCLKKANQNDYINEGDAEFD